MEYWLIRAWRSSWPSRSLTHLSNGERPGEQLPADALGALVAEAELCGPPSEPLQSAPALGLRRSRLTPAPLQQAVPQDRRVIQQLLLPQYLPQRQKCWRHYFIFVKIQKMESKES